jgi:hypothetical protein
LPVLRAVYDCLAAEQRLVESQMRPYLGWLTDSIRQNREHAAFEFAGSDFNSESSNDGPLDETRRILAVLSQAGFGATALEVAHESNPTRLVVLFGDDLFHMAWAELVFGWLLALADGQLSLAANAPQYFPLDEEARSEYAGLSKQITARLGNRLRCRVEEIVDPAGNRRYLFHNFRRLASGAPARILL